MGEVVEFKRTNTKSEPILSFWDNFKEILRKYYDEIDVHLIVAAILDKDCYEKTNDTIRKAADLYYKFAPAK